MKKNITTLMKKYGSQYVARSKKTGNVVAHAKRIDMLLNKVKDKQSVVVSWIPEAQAKYVFRFSLRVRNS